MSETTFDIINDIDNSTVASFDSREAAEYQLQNVRDLYAGTIKKIYSKIEGIKIRLVQAHLQFDRESASSYEKRSFLEYIEKYCSEDELKIVNYKPTSLMQAIVTNNLRIIEKPKEPTTIKVDFSDFNFKSPTYLKNVHESEMLWVVALSNIAKTGHYVGEDLDLDEWQWHRKMVEEATDHEMGPEIEIPESMKESYDRIVKIFNGEIVEKPSRGSRWVRRNKRQ